MKNQTNSNQTDPFAAAAGVAKGIGNLAGSAIDSATQTAEQLLEQGTQSAGKTLEKAANNPAIKFASNTFGGKWLKAMLGEVEIDKVQLKVQQFQQKYPGETSEQIANRLITDKAVLAAGVGFATNIIPPIAAMLFGIELAANVVMQAEMVYEIAAAYGYDLTQSQRRGEVATIFALAFGGDVMKAGLGFVELIPGVGAVVGASSNAATFYALGLAANRFYQRRSQATVPTVDGEII